MKRLLTLMLIPSIALGQVRTDIEPDPDPRGTGEPDIQVEGDLSSVEVNSRNGVTKNYNGAGSGRPMPVSSAISPSMITSGAHSCLMSKSEGLQLAGVGVSRGEYFVDVECERRLNSQAMAALGMRVSAVAVLCTDAVMFRAMLISGTPCPVLGKGGSLLVGKRALVEIKTRPHLWIPDWEENEEWYTEVLAGENNVEEDTGGSISDRFRSSKRERVSGSGE